MILVYLYYFTIKIVCNYLLANTTFVYPNIEIGIGNNNVFWIRWTLVAFIIIISLLLTLFLPFNKISIDFKGDEDYKDLTKHKVIKDFSLAIIIYFVSILIYLVRNIIRNEASPLNIIASTLSKYESIIILLMFILFAIGYTYRNKDTFFNLFFRILATLELSFIISYYITGQVELTKWYNWVGVFLLGIIFIILLKINLIILKDSKYSVRNTSDPAVSYDETYSRRSHQINELLDLVQNESAFSVCVSGEWGIGKTSFVNGVIDRAKKNHREEKEKKPNIYEIRINAMELDNTKSLIEYFFIKVKKILVENNVYVGIGSEYLELASSVISVIASDGIGKFIMGKLNINRDYRENIDKLNNILINNLNNSKIVIVVDDVDRCSPEKASQFIYFIKEIATMKNCLTIFLVDYIKLTKMCGFEENFLEKYFDHRISLKDVNSDDILDGLKQYCAEEINEIRIFLLQTEVSISENINNAWNKNKLKFSNVIDHEKYIKKLVFIKNTLSCFTTNSRRLKKLVNLYIRYNKVIEDELAISKKTNNRYDVFLQYLNNVNYKKQIFSLSFIYAFYESEFDVIQSQGIQEYLDKLEYYLKEGKDNTIVLIDYMISIDWKSSNNYFLENSECNYIEVLRFIDYLIKVPKKLINVSHDYNTLEEKCIDKIKNGILPLEKSIPELILIIYISTNGRQEEREELIRKTFDLLDKARYMFINWIEMVFSIFVETQIHSVLTDETPILKLFVNTFCKGVPVAIKMENFEYLFTIFAEKYLFYKTNFIWQYLEAVNFPIGNNFIDSSMSLNRTNNKLTCEDILKAYCNKWNYRMENKLTNEVDALTFLDSIVESANKIFSEYNFIDCCDIRSEYEKVKTVLSEIKYLFEIEIYINKCIDASKEELNNTKPMLANIYSFIDNYSDKLSNDDKFNLTFEELINLFHFICDNDISISLNQYNKLNNIIQNWYSKNKVTTGKLRRKLIHIYNNNLKKNI